MKYHCKLSLILAILALPIFPTVAQVAEIDTRVHEKIELPSGTPLTFATVEELSSKTHVKGDFVDLVTTSDVVIKEAVLIPKGTKTVGQISSARATGGLGQNGKLGIEPLYLRLGDDTVRLSGDHTEGAKVPAGTVIGMALVSPLFSGTNAVIPAGTELGGSVLRSISLPAVGSITE